MYHLWEELEAYYRVRLSEMERAERAQKMTEATSVAASD